MGWVIFVLVNLIHLLKSPEVMGNKQLLRLVSQYLNDNGIVMDYFDADQFMIDQLKEGIRISEIQLAVVIEEYYISIQ